MLDPGGYFLVLPKLSVAIEERLTSDGSRKE